MSECPAGEPSRGEPTMKKKRPRYRVETFKMLIMAVGVFALTFWARDGGFTKSEGIITAAICSFISFFLGRISVPEGGMPSDHYDQISE